MKMYKKKYAKDLKEIIYENEFDCTLDGGWAINNETYEHKIFNDLSDEGKTVYAMYHAKEYAHMVMNWSDKKFYKYFGDNYVLNHDDAIKDYEKICKTIY